MSKGENSLFLRNISLQSDKGSRSSKPTYHSNQQLTFKSIGLLVLIIVDYIGVGWI